MEMVIYEIYPKRWKLKKSGKYAITIKKGQLDEKKKVNTIGQERVRTLSIQYSQLHPKEVNQLKQVSPAFFENCKDNRRKLNISRNQVE